MLANPAGYLTGHCGDPNPDAHTRCSGTASRGSGASELGEMTCVCLCHTDERAAFLQQLLEGVAWRTRDTDTGEVRLHRTEQEARAYARLNDYRKALARGCPECGSALHDSGDNTMSALHDTNDTPLCHGPEIDDEERALLDAASTSVSEEVSA